MTLKDIRQELAVAVGAIPYLPERINPPVVLISPDEPYIVPETVCDTAVKYALTIVAAKQTSQQANDALDDEIDRVLDALPDAYSWTEVTQPFVLEWNGANYLSTRIRVETNT